MFCLRVSGFAYYTACVRVFYLVAFLFLHYSIYLYTNIFSIRLKCCVYVWRGVSCIILFVSESFFFLFISPSVFSRQVVKWRGFIIPFKFSVGIQSVYCLVSVLCNVSKCRAGSVY